MTQPLLENPQYNWGPPVLCDFGQARFGDYDRRGRIQPFQYRAPEVILDIEWDEKVDIWNVAMLVSRIATMGNLGSREQCHRHGTYSRMARCLGLWNLVEITTMLTIWLTWSRCSAHRPRSFSNDHIRRKYGSSLRMMVSCFCCGPMSDGSAQY